MRTGIERVLIDSQVTPYQVIDGDHAHYGGDENQHSARHDLASAVGSAANEYERADDNKRGNDCSRPDRTGRKKLIMAALWTEVRLAMPAIQAAGEGYEVYGVTDVSGGGEPGSACDGGPPPGHGRPRSDHLGCGGERAATRLGPPGNGQGARRNCPRSRRR